MAIVTSQLLASKVLQEWLLDKDTGLPLAAGIINLYQDDNRLLRKNWYYKTGSPGSGYTYTTLPNPMTLNGAGAIVDSSGNEVTPFYYPYDEDDSTIPQLYYITVYNSDGTLQFTKQGFPPINRSDSTGEVSTLQNLIVNNQFWNQNSSSQSGGENTLNLTNETDIVICPSNHDGYSMPDIRFMKDVVGANDTISFRRIPNSDPLFTGNLTPQFYIHISCTSTQNESYKFIQFPICLNTRNLEQQPYIFTVQTKLPSGAPTRNITVQMLAYEGSGTTVSNGANIGTITPTSSWNKTTITQSQFAAIVSPSPTKDDAYYLQLALPRNQTYDFYIAVPSLYLGTLSATNDFQSYDYIDSITNSPRTGDYRHSLNRYMLGWVPANDGTIGQEGSGATTRANTDTWPLYKLIYENFSRTWTPLSPNSPTTAYADFIAGKTLALTKNLGRVLVGLNPLFTSSVFTAAAGKVDFTTDFATNSALTLLTAHTYTAGTPVQVFSTGTLPGGLTAGEVYYISSFSLTTTEVYLSSTYAEAIAGFNITLHTSNGTGTLSITTTTPITLTTAQAPVLTTGTPIQVSNSGGALPAPLVSGTVYYVSSNPAPTSTIIYLSETLTDAYAGVLLPITTNGTGTNTISTALGAYDGESFTRDVASHAHPFTSDDNFYKIASGSTIGTGNTDQISAKVTGVTDYIGESQVSIIQPSAYVNVWLKL